jgi:hypothetical protein
VDSWQAVASWLELEVQLGEDLMAPLEVQQEEEVVLAPSELMQEEVEQ